jgi:FkbM family methyltransferase
MVLDLVQIGANIGNDEIFRRVVIGDFKTGLLVEANPECMPILRTNYRGYPGFIFDNVAIANFNGKIKFHVPTPDGMKNLDPNDPRSFLPSEHSSLDSRFPQSIHPLKEIEVECLTLDGLFAKHNIDHAKTLIIDAEGFDFHILMNNLTDRVNVDTIIYEHTSTDGKGRTGSNNELLKEYLVSRGYHFSFCYEYNTVFVRG